MTQLQNAEIRALASRFAKGRECGQPKPFGDGHINDTYLYAVRSLAGEELFVLQRINQIAFPKPREVMDNIVRITRYLRERIAEEGGDPSRETIDLQATDDGEYLTVDSVGDCWRSYRFLGGVKSYGKCESEDVFYESARAFGRFQRRLGGFDAASLYETIVDFHNTPARFEAFERAVSEDRAGRLSGVRELADAALGYKPLSSELTSKLAAGLLPLRVTHNDTKLNNVLMDEVTGRGMCVIDLDTVMPGLSAYDFGDAIRFGASTVAEDEPDAESARLSLPLYRAYAQGYISEVGSMLTDEELLSLPTGARLMTLECFIRFLGDYLNGDVYFKTDYPTHNLTRARTQLALLRDMDGHWGDMTGIIDEIRTEARA